MNRAGLSLALPVLAGLVAGCSENGGMYAQQQRVIQDAEPDAVLDAAAAILQREFGRLRVDRTGRRIITVPVEFTTASESGTARDLYGGQSRMRRMARFNVGRRGGTTVARLRVDVERLDTARRQVMQPREYRLSDTPGSETPITRDAATTEQQNTVWTRVRRDTRLERALLEELREQFAPLAAETDVPGTRGEPPADESSEPATEAKTRN